MNHLLLNIRSHIGEALAGTLSWCGGGGRRSDILQGVAEPESSALSQVTMVVPLLSSPIVSDAAFHTMLKLARCIAPPLCNWPPEIASALRIISTEDAQIVWELFPSIDEGEAHKRPSLGIFEQTVAGLAASCNSGPLPADTFTSVFPIMEQILLSSKKTALHDSVLHILSMHVDPILPLPRPRMLSVLYHVLGVFPAYQLLVAPMLNEICLGLQADELANALSGVYAKDVHVRLACLNAIKCIPSVSGRALQWSIEVATSIWIVLHDPEKLSVSRTGQMYSACIAGRRFLIHS